jgi:hypothetical protein
MVHLEVESYGPLAVASMTPSLEPSQSHGFVDSKILFAKELSYFLSSLEKACPKSGQEIACLLSEKDTGDKIKKMKDYPMSKCKKSGITRKAYATANG